MVWLLVSQYQTFLAVDVNDVWLGPIRGAPRRGRSSIPNFNDRHHSHRQRTLAGPPSINCARQQITRTHDARKTRTCFYSAQRGRPPSSARSLGSHSPFDRCPEQPHSEEDTRNRPGCGTQEDIWRPEGPGQDFPELVRTPWRGPEERHEVRRLVQDQGDPPQGSRLGTRIHVSMYTAWTDGNRSFLRSRLPACEAEVVLVSPLV